VLIGADYNPFYAIETGTDSGSDMARRRVEIRGTATVWAFL
jgi:hypothetical protein